MTIVYQSCNRGSFQLESYYRNECQVSFKVDPAPLECQPTISQHNPFSMDGMFTIPGTKTEILAALRRGPGQDSDVRDADVLRRLDHSKLISFSLSLTYCNTSTANHGCNNITHEPVLLSSFNSKSDHFTNIFIFLLILRNTVNL